jgi:hypothetical protein
LVKHALIAIGVALVAVGAYELLGLLERFSWAALETKARTLDGRG